jgi:hypothetical protein
MVERSATVAFPPVSISKSAHARGSTSIPPAFTKRAVSGPRRPKASMKPRAPAPSPQNKNPAR